MKKSNRPTTLLIGIGNSGRSDDALGWAFAERMKANPGFVGDVVLRYQLQVEDADLIKDYSQVYFVDACHIQLPDGYSIEKCEASKDFSFTTHELSPETILFLCEDLYGQKPEARLVLIQGEKWELNIGMSDAAQLHLTHALAGFLISLS